MTPRDREVDAICNALDARSRARDEAEEARRVAEKYPPRAKAREALWQYPDDHPEYGVQTDAERAACARLRASTASEDARREVDEAGPAWRASQKRTREANR